MANKISIFGGASAIPEESVAHLDLELIYQSGVVKPATDWVVSEQNPKDRTVNVAIGRGYFVKTGMVYNGYSTAVNNVAIAANSSGYNRVDAIVAYVDLSAAAGVDATGVLKFVAVAGTPASTPVIPDAAAIATAIGAGNPYTILASVLVANSASQIENANITDLRASAYIKIPQGLYQTNLMGAIVKTSQMPVITLTDAATIIVDCSLGQNFQVTIAGDRTFSFINYQIGQPIYLDIKQDSTGGRVWTLPADVHWPYDVVPPLTTTPNKIDSFIFRCYATNKLRGYVGGQSFTY